MEAPFPRQKIPNTLFLREFKGVGPTTINIFLRELRPVWKKTDSKVSPLAGNVAVKIGLKNRKVKR